MSNGITAAEEHCRQRLETVLGMTSKQAEELVGHYAAAASEQMLEQMAGTGPVPSSLSAHRADLLHRTCRRAKRILSEREMAVLLRVTDSTAGTVRREMLATYEQLLQELLLDAALEDCRWTTHIDGAGKRCAKLTLSSPTAARTIEYQLRRLHLWADVERDGRSILFPDEFDDWIDPIRPPKGLL